ncbi:MAG: DUF4920 domain-containing protein [Pseudobdellovibrionaceae bacterium]
MFRCLLHISIAISFSIAAADMSMPPKSPKAQTSQPPVPNATGEYGVVQFTAKEAKTLPPSVTEKEIIIKTTVAEVCTKKGCWMNVKNPNQTDQVRVTFKDYGFFVPTELVGKEVALQGRYVKHIESVEEQKHLLQDAKRPQKEIDAITKPKETLRFVATGVKDLSVPSTK